MLWKDVIIVNISTLICRVLTKAKPKWITKFLRRKIVSKITPYMLKISGYIISYVLTRCLGSTLYPIRRGGEIVLEKGWKRREWGYLPQGDHILRHSIFHRKAEGRHFKKDLWGECGTSLFSKQSWKICTDTLSHQRLRGYDGGLFQGQYRPLSWRGRRCYYRFSQSYEKVKIIANLEGWQFFRQPSLFSSSRQIGIWSILFVFKQAIQFFRKAACIKLGKNKPFNAF